MPTPATRTPLRVARGTYSNLNSSVSDIQEGEIVYATDQDKLYVKEGSSLVSTQATVPAIDQVGGVQGYDADTAKTDVAQNFTAGQRGAITTLTDAAFVGLDLGDSNNFVLTFTSTIGNTREISNPVGTIVPGQSGSIFLVQDSAGSRTVSWGSYWDFAGGTVPTLSTATNAVDRVDYVVRTATSIHAVFTGNYS